MHPDVERSETVYRGVIVRLRVDHLRAPAGSTAVREVVEHPGGAAVVPVFPNGDLLLVRQYRHPVRRDVIELPAGKLDAGEEPLRCAQRELREETGHRSDDWRPLTAMLATPGVCDEVLHLFAARDVRPDPLGQELEEGESSLRLLRVTMDEALRMVKQGGITDGKTIVGIMMLHQGMDAP